MILPLQDLVVVEVGTSVAAPFATSILQQLGAEVVKVERPPHGDPARGWRPPDLDGHGVMFSVFNAGKKSAALDLSTGEGCDALRTLIADADVLMSALRPGSLASLGLDLASLRAANQRLIVCELSAFGQVGPMRRAPGYDPLIQAMSGLMAVTGHEGLPPVRVGTSIIDMATAMWAVIGILSSLRERDAGEPGGHVDVSLLETGLAWLPYQIAGFLSSGVEPRRNGSTLPNLAPYQAFPTAEGDLVIACGTDRSWQQLCTAIHRPDLATDPDLATNAKRVRRRDKVVTELTSTLSARTAEAWEEILLAAAVPCAMVRSVSQALEHPQVQALEVVLPVEDAAGLHVPVLPMLLNGRRPRLSGSVPSFGQDDDAILTLSGPDGPGG